VYLPPARFRIGDCRHVNGGLLWLPMFFRERVAKCHPLTLSRLAHYEYIGEGVSSRGSERTEAVLIGPLWVEDGLRPEADAFEPPRHHTLTALRQPAFLHERGDFRANSRADDGIAYRGSNQRSFGVPARPAQPLGFVGFNRCCEGIRS